jgi:Domain of unknown function (DUF4136)
MRFKSINVIGAGGPLLLALAFSGCASTPNTISNVAPGVDFSQYSTFGFVANPATNNANYEALETSYLKVAVSQELDRRGMSYSETPDILINFYINTKEKIRSRSVPTMGAYYGWRHSYYDPWVGYGGYETHIDQFTEGTLNIDVVDASTNKLVWEGSVSGRVTDRNIRDLEATIDDAVKAIMVDFPVTPVVR